jgi:hypothetical protein
MLSSCKKDKNMMVKIEKFEWLAETSGDVSCPVEIVYGKFIMSDGSTGFMPSGQYLNGSWGISRGSMSVGEDRKKVPDSLKIVWFSYAENKFFEGHFELPQKKCMTFSKKITENIKIQTEQNLNTNAIHLPLVLLLKVC